MKQIVTLFILLFACMTSTYAVTSTVVATDNATTSLTVDSQSNSFFGKAKVWAQKTMIKAAKMMDDDQKILQIILAFVLSPIAVYLYEGKTWTNRVTLNLVLYLLTFGLGGLIHALYLILGEK